MSSQQIDKMVDDAALWVARMDAGTLDDIGKAQLERWLASDPRHEGALLRAQAAWMSLDRVSRAPVRIMAPATRRRVLAGAGVAAAGAFATGVLFLNDAPMYRTAVGEVRRLPLTDGSTVVINTASTLRVNVTADRREIGIDHGEAWFQVAKDPQRPFLVEAGDIRVRAVGTAFSVRRYANGAQILVTEGVVEAWADGADGHRARLTAGDQAFVANNAQIGQSPPSASAVERTLAWRWGQIDLVDKPLLVAAEEFNRYNVRQIAITDPVIAAEKLDGLFRTDDPEGFARAVANSFIVPIDVSDPAIIRIGQSGPGSIKNDISAKEK